MTWKNGKRELKQYPSIEANKQAFKSLWKRLYGNRFPTMADAIRYSGNDNAEAWLKNVVYYLNN